MEKKLTFVLPIYNVEKYVELLDLKPFLHSFTRELSLGQRMRCEIAASLLHSPRILFLDEPTLGLDVIARHELWDAVRSLKGKTTIILTTHYMEEAEALSDKVAIMRTGRLLILETPEQIKKQTGAANLEQAFLTVVKEERI